MTASRGPHAAVLARLLNRLARLSPQRVSAVATAYRTNPAPFDALGAHLMRIAEREGRAEAARETLRELMISITRVTAPPAGDEAGSATERAEQVQHAVRVLLLLPLALLVSDYVSEDDFDLAETYFTSATGEKPYAKRPDLMARWRWVPASTE